MTATTHDPTAPGQNRVVRDGLRLLGRAIRRRPGAFGLAVAGSTLFALMTVASSVVLGRVTDTVIVPALSQGELSRAALVTGCVAIMAVATLKGLGVILRRSAASWMQLRLEADDRLAVSDRYQSLPMSWHAQHPTGELLSIANSDVEASYSAIAPLPFSVGAAVMAVTAVIVLAVTDPLLAGVAVVAVPVLALVNASYNRRIAPVWRDAQAGRADLAGVAHESFDGALVVKTLGREEFETERFDAQAQSLRTRLVRVGRIQAVFNPLLEALPTLTVLSLVAVGATRVAAGAITEGQLVQVAYLFVLLEFPLRVIGFLFSDLPRNVVGAERVASVLGALGRATHGTSELPAAEGGASVAVESVHFAYAGDPPVLQDLQVDLHAGTTVALVGATGSGKSTVAALLVRLLDPASGTITLDGVDLRELRFGVVPSTTAIVFQDTFLFDESVRENVTMGAPLDDDDVWAALELAQAADFVRALPAGLDTVLGERGTSLSGGQRQRVALARALARSPRLLVLDDATSSVDPRVEARILAGLRAAALPSTVVVIATRPSTIALADDVIVVDRGRVRARGTHAELSASDPAYVRLIHARDDAPEDPR